MEYVFAFLVGGFFCLTGQLFMDIGKWSPAHIMGGFVVGGALMDGFHLYDKLIDLAGMGAILPISSFGHFLVHGAMTEAERYGFLGIGMGIFEVTSAGVSTAILFGFLASIIFKPKG
ncbi:MULTISPECIES: stage V sporulation protein AE [Alteribacter]|uniref:Stage V sporulation protein AE n=1 Tax=Alteribacter keqinensis TaxID=2483800 RepID=A0A3M7TTV7_9BACI|nr:MULTISPECIES: stage V sporulation protein AE [Alteribacter]MBM7094736.1 stage V sporulation protein AE [Alteribacter salitolerans]RNA69068.1 stage V sporulation protein AE [Alteribacter keqinensis]